MTKQLVRYSLAVMTTLLGLVILWQFRVVVIYVLISVTFAATLRPLINRLRARTLVKRLGWIVVSILILGIIVYSLYMVGKVAIGEIQILANSISTQDEWTLPAWLQGTLFKQVLFSRLLPPSKLFQAATFGQAQAMLPAVLGFTQGLASTLSGIFIILVMSFYWILNKSHFERLWLSLLPSGARKQAREIWQTIEPELGSYVRSQVAVNVVAAVLLGLGYWIIGLPYPMLLAVIGSFAATIPFIGAAIAVIIPLVLGLLAGMQFTPAVVFYTIVVMIALGLWLKPRLFYRRRDSPMLTLLLLVALADAFGLIGIIVAPPLALIIQIIWNQMISQRVVGAENVQVLDFKQRIESVWARINRMEEPPPPDVTNTMERLAQLIEKADPMIQAAIQDAPAKPTLPGTPASSQG